MRVAQLAPVWEKVPPERYGGTEIVVKDLTDELAKDPAFEQVLACSSDSRIDDPGIRRVETSIASLRNNPDLSTEEKLRCEEQYIAEAFEGMIAAGVDLIHNHSGEIAIDFANQLAKSCKIPILTTTHNMPTADRMSIWKKNRGYWNTISKQQKEVIGNSPGGTYTGAIYNAINVSSFEFGNRSDKENYLLFVGRFSPEKGLHFAIKAALKAEIPITIAAKEPDCQRDVDYKRDFIDPLLALPGVKYIGEVGPAQKRKLYKHARALLVPLCWEEPFGLVLAEALASGTPVIAFRRGAAPEIIVDRITGYLVNDVDEMVTAIKKIDLINPEWCRDDMIIRFDLPVMAKAYKDCYQWIVEGGERKPHAFFTELYSVQF